MSEIPTSAVPAWPVVNVQMTEDGGALVDGAPVPRPPDGDSRAAAINAAAQTAQLLGRPVRVDATEADGTVYPLVVTPQGEASEAGAAIPAPKQRRRLTRRSRRAPSPTADTTPPAPPPSVNLPPPAEQTPYAAQPPFAEPAAQQPPATPAPYQPIPDAPPPPGDWPPPVPPAPTQPDVAHAPPQFNDPQFADPAVHPPGPAIADTSPPAPPAPAPVAEPFGDDGAAVSEGTVAAPVVGPPTTEPPPRPPAPEPAAAQPVERQPRTTEQPAAPHPDAFTPPSPSPDQARLLDEIHRAVTENALDRALATARSLAEEHGGSTEGSRDAAREIHAYVTLLAGDPHQAARLYVNVAMSWAGRTGGPDGWMRRMAENAHYCWLLIDDPHSAYDVGRSILDAYTLAVDARQPAVTAARARLERLRAIVEAA